MKTKFIILLLIILAVIISGCVTQIEKSNLEEKAIDLIRSQEIFSFMESYESIRSSDSFKIELRNKILNEIGKNSDLNTTYKSNKAKSDEIINEIVNMRTETSFSAETLSDGNIKVNVLLNEEVVGNYIVNQNKIIETNVRLVQPAPLLDKQTIMNQIYMDYSPIVFQFLGTKTESDIEFKENEIIYFYYPGCPLCGPAEEYINNLKSKYGITIRELNVHENNENLELAKKYAKSLVGDEFNWVPFIIVNNNYVIGWTESKEAELESYIIK